jgi:hypothetical protein
MIQPMIRSNEGSSYGTAKDGWAPDGGTKAEKVPFVEQALWLGGAATGGVMLYKHAPGFINQGMTQAQIWGFGNGPIANSSTADFWYKFSRRVETSQAGGSYMSNLFRMFASAPRISETLSFFADRGSSEYFLDISARTLGTDSRDMTLKYLDKNFSGLKRSALDSVDALAFHKNKVYRAAKTYDKEGKAVFSKFGEALDSARLGDKGRFFFGFAVQDMPELGRRDSLTGKIAADKVFGNEGYVLMPEQIGAKVSDVNPFSSSAKRLPNWTKLAQSYMAMGVQRTSFLMDELFDEFKAAAEYVSPDAKKWTFGAARKLGILPQFTLDTFGGQLGRYAGTAVKVFAGLAAVNQAGYSLQNGGVGEKALGGVMQSAILAGVGYKIAGIFGQSSKAGAIAGAGLGLASMVGVGPFTEGIIPGGAFAAGKLNEFRSRIGEFTFVNDYKRFVERVMPDSTDFTTAIGMGIAAGVTYTAASRWLNKDVNVTEASRQAYLEGVEWNKITDLESKQITSDPSRLKRFNSLSNEVKQKIEAEISGFIEVETREGRTARLANDFGKAGDTVGARALSFGQTLTNHSYEIVKEEILKSRTSGIAGFAKTVNQAIQKAPFMRASLYASMIGTAGWALMTGQLGTLETPQEIAGLNSGQILEEVKRGQNWEFGSTPYEGTDTLFYRPTFIARASSGATQAGASGDRGMLEEFFLKNFTYKMEEEDYYTRPAPITSGAFDQLPFIYPLIKPIADLIKPAKLMHVDEWKENREGEDYYLERSTGLDSLPNLSLGGTPMAAPYSPYNPLRYWSKAFDQSLTAMGLVGFYARSLIGGVSGDDQFFNQRNELESYSENLDMTSRFYDLHSGGGFMGVPFVSEIIRRFLPQSDTKKYNPIANALPSWMPQELKVGNPYASTRYGGGEYRMPGEGYAQLHPELKGVDPEDYPNIHKMIILGDVAPWSEEYRSTLDNIKTDITQGVYNERQMSFINRYAKQIEVKKQRNFDPYVGGGDYQHINGTVESFDPINMTVQIKEKGGNFKLAGMSNNLTDLMTNLNLSSQDAARIQERNAARMAKYFAPGKSVNITVPNSPAAAVDSEGNINARIGSGLGLTSFNQELLEHGQFAFDQTPFAKFAINSGAESQVTRAWENASHSINKMAAPLEYLTMFGFSPTMKFMPSRDAIEDYEAMQLYGQEIRSWNKPLQDWFLPAARTAAHNWLGVDFIPKGVQENREIDSYFDKLKYFKYDYLHNQAVASGDQEAAYNYKSIRDFTIMGSHGRYEDQRFTKLMGGIESRYAYAFANEQNTDRRQKILDLLPEHKRRIMMSKYAMEDSDALGRLYSSAAISPEGERAFRLLSGVAADEGYLRTEESYGDYLANKQEGDTFSSFQRKKEMQAFISNNQVPAPDWLGFNPAVDLEDVKLKYIENEGKDYHDFGIYKSRAEYLPRKNYISNEMVSQVSIQPMALQIARNALQEVNRIMNLRHTSINHQTQSPMRNNNYVSVNLEQNHYVNPFQ